MPNSVFFHVFHIQKYFSILGVNLFMGMQQTERPKRVALFVA